MSYMAYPYYLPPERLTMVVLRTRASMFPGSWAIMQDITRIITRNNLCLAYRSSRIGALLGEARLS